MPYLYNNKCQKNILLCVQWVIPSLLVTIRPAVFFTINPAVSGKQLIVAVICDIIKNFLGSDWMKLYIIMYMIMI